MSSGRAAPSTQTPSQQTNGRATGRQSFRDETLVFWGTGMMVDDLKQVGTLHWLREWLQTSQKIEASCSAQEFSVDGEVLSGPAAFLIFSFVKRFFTSHDWIKGGGRRPESESGGTDCLGLEWLETLVVFCQICCRSDSLDLGGWSHCLQVQVFVYTGYFAESPATQRGCWILKTVFQVYFGTVLLLF